MKPSTTPSDRPLAAATAARRPQRARRLALHVALVFAAIGGADAARAQATSVNAVDKGRCASGYSLLVNGNSSPPYAYCRRTVNTTVRDYLANYQPCLPPGAYVASDESPGGALPAGHDRCTAAGLVSGPALPCPPTHALREIRNGQVDRCYRNVTQSTNQYVDVTLYQ